jgi:putative aldouronate transport system permease protein
MRRAVSARGSSREAKPRKATRLQVSDVVLSLLAILLIALTVAPLLYALALSFSSNLASVRAGVTLWPQDFSLEGYQVAWRRLQLWRPFTNSVIVTTIGTFFHVLFCATAAYVLLQQAYKLRGFTIAMIALSMSVPGEAIMVPLYLVNKQLGLLNTLTALILSGLVSGFSILLLFNYFRSVPRSLVDAARIDGANQILIFTNVFLPVSLPGLAAVALFEIVSRWNQFTAPLLYLTDERKFTVQLALQSVVSSNDSVSGADVILPNVRMAAVVIGVGILVLMFPLIQRFFVKGITLGATKE